MSQRVSDERLADLDGTYKTPNVDETRLIVLDLRDARADLREAEAAAYLRGQEEMRDRAATTASAALAQKLNVVFAIRVLQSSEGIRLFKPEMTMDTNESPRTPEDLEVYTALIREKALEGGQWMVIRKIDTEPIEVWLGDGAEMRRVFVRAGEQWTETYLARVVAGPGNPLATPPATEEAK